MYFWFIFFSILFFSAHPHQQNTESCLTISPRGPHLHTSMHLCMPFFLPGMLDRLLVILQSLAISNTFSNTPTLTSQQSWALLPLCYTILHAKTYLLSFRSWSLSSKQGGIWPAPTSCSSKSGCATAAICGWNSWNKWYSLCAGPGQLFSRDRQLEEPPGDSQIPVRFRPFFLPIPLSPS